MPKFVSCTLGMQRTPQSISLRRNVDTDVCITGVSNPLRTVFPRRSKCFLTCVCPNHGIHELDGPPYMTRHAAVDATYGRNVRTYVRVNVHFFQSRKRWRIGVNFFENPAAFSMSRTSIRQPRHSSTRISCTLHSLFPYQSTIGMPSERICL